MFARSATSAAVFKPWALSLPTMFLPSLARERISSGLIGRIALMTSLPMRRARAVPVRAFSPADTPALPPMVTTAMITSGRR